MLLELAVGDAYGAGFEYVGEGEGRLRRHNDLSGYVQHPRHRGVAPGAYTDDTQMSLAIVEALLAGDRWTPHALAERFVEVFERDPREGYARRFHQFLEEVESGSEFLARIRPRSDKSGAAMRSPALGVLSSIGEVLDKTEVQARITHDTPDGVHAALAAALMTHYFLRGLGPKRDLPDFLQGEVPGQWSVPWVGKVGPKGWMSVRAAVTAVVAADRLSDLLQACVAYSGDVDTVAAIALAAGSCCDEIEQDLPDCLVEGLENGEFGRDYLIDLDRRLLSRRW